MFKRYLDPCAIEFLGDPPSNRMNLVNRFRYYLLFCAAPLPLIFAQFKTDLILSPHFKKVSDERLSCRNRPTKDFFKILPSPILSAVTAKPYLLACPSIVIASIAWWYKTSLKQSERALLVCVAKAPCTAHRFLRGHLQEISVSLIKNYIPAMALGWKSPSDEKTAMPVSNVTNAPESEPPSRKENDKEMQALLPCSSMSKKSSFETVPFVSTASSSDLDEKKPTADLRDLITFSRGHSGSMIRFKYDERQHLRLYRVIFHLIFYSPLPPSFYDPSIPPKQMRQSEDMARCSPLKNPVYRAITDQLCPLEENCLEALQDLSPTLHPRTADGSLEAAEEKPEDCLEEVPLHLEKENPEGGITSLWAENHDLAEQSLETCSTAPITPRKISKIPKLRLKTDLKDEGGNLKNCCPDLNIQEELTKILKPSCSQKKARSIGIKEKLSPRTQLREIAWKAAAQACSTPMPLKNQSKSPSFADRLSTIGVTDGAFKKFQKPLKFSDTQLFHYHFELNTPIPRSHFLSKFCYCPPELPLFGAGIPNQEQWQIICPAKINDQKRLICFLKWEKMPEKLQKIYKTPYAEPTMMQREECIKAHPLKSVEWQDPKFLSPIFEPYTTSLLWREPAQGGWCGANPPLNGKLGQSIVYGSSNIHLLLHTLRGNRATI